MTFGQDWTRRVFLQNIGAGAPTVKLILGPSSASKAEGSVAEPCDSIDSGKFAPIDLSPHFTASSSDFGPRDAAKRMGGASRHDGLIHTPSGNQNLRGIPFLLGPAGPRDKSWIVLSGQRNSWTTDAVEVPVNRKAGSLCLAQFCDWDANETPPPGQDVYEKLGQHLTDVSFIFEDGSDAVLPIRRRFEVNAPSVEWGHLSFASLAHTADAGRRLTDPLHDAMEWGDLQMGLMDNSYSTPVVWVSALANPRPDDTIKSLRFKAVGDEPLVICGLTLFLGQGNPLRYERLATYRITLPEPADRDQSAWQIAVDLGVVARQ